MPSKPKLKRKSFFVDVRALQRARKVLGARTHSEAVRLAVERIVEMEMFWQFMDLSRGSLRPGSPALIDNPPRKTSD